MSAEFVCSAGHSPSQPSLDVAGYKSHEEWCKTPAGKITVHRQMADASLRVVESEDTWTGREGGRGQRAEPAGLEGG